MRTFKLSSKLFVSAFALLIATNALMLLGVYLNRTSETTSEVTLTQRELQLSNRIQKENNSVSLRLVYRTENRSGSHNNFLNHDKLKELGFDTDKHLYSKEGSRATTKEVFVVLENDGEAYKRSLKSAEAALTKNEALYSANKDDERSQRAYENAKNELAREQISQSRLFAVDAGLDYERLRQKYPDKTKHLILKGVVRLVKEHKEKSFYGYIQHLNIQTIHLPYKFKHLLKDIKPMINHKNEQSTPPKYKMEVKYGSRYEPFITSVKVIY